MSKVTTLGAVEPFDYVAVALSDGETVEGRATDIDYVPDERLRLELRPRESPVRYELKAERHRTRWSPIRVRRCDTESDGHEWVDRGTVAGVAVDPDVPPSV